MFTKPKDTQHKVEYININVYQTNSPPKLVTTKTFFPLTWSSPPKSITPPEEWHSILKFLPLFDTIVKGHKKPKDMTGDRQKNNKKGTRRTRNHIPTRKIKTRCYGHKDNQKYAKHVKKNACKRISIDQEVARQVSSIIDADRCSYWGTNQQKAKKISIDPPGVEKLSRRQELSRSIH